MQITNIAIDKLNPAKYNPRLDLKPEDKEYQDIKRSIVEFGLVEPLVINKGNIIVGGHQRYKVLKELNFTTVPCITVDLNKQKEKMLNIALNKISGDWDRIKLKDILEELDSGEFDVTLTGFGEQEIEDLMTEFHVDSEEDDFDVDKAVEEVGEPICKRGDIWQLGEHRLGCLDATVEEDVKKLMDGEKAGMVFTDPPYGIDYKSNWREQKTKTKFDKIKGDSKVTDIYPMLRSICKNNSVIYLWTSHQVYPQWRGFAKDIYKSTIIWYKKTGGMGDLKAEYGHNYEMCIYSMIGRCEFIGDRPKAVWEIGTENFNELIHPTQKPVSLAVNAIKHHALSNVVDLFGGSGSTLIACEQLNRKCYMAEIDPVYIQVILERYIQYKGTSDDVFLLKDDKRIPYKEIF